MAKHGTTTPRGGSVASRGSSSNRGGNSANSKHKNPSSSRQSTSTSRAPISPPLLRRQGDGAANTEKAVDPSTGWTVPKLVDRLKGYQAAVEACHITRLRHVIGSATVRDRRVHAGKDLFSGFRSKPARSERGETMELKVKVKVPSLYAPAGQLQSMTDVQRQDEQEVRYNVVCLKADKIPVPRYFSHPVHIRENVIAPQTSMAFYPHKGDMDSPRAERKWNGFIRELDQSEDRSGLDPIRPDERRAFVLHYERLFGIYLYLNKWLKDLNLANGECNKWLLTRYIVEDEPDEDVTDLHLKNVARPHQSVIDTKAARHAAQMFVSAWDQVFTPEKTRYGVELDPLGLLEVLRLDKDVHEWMNHKPEPEKPRRSSDSIGDAYETLESNLSTYSTLGCLICFNHSCEHGFFTDDNKKERFSLDTGWLSRRLAERHKHTLPAEKSAVTPCTRNCYKSVSRSEGGGAPWSNDDRKTLHSIFMAFSFGRLRTDPACHVAFLLNRECCDVQSEYKNMRLTMYRPTAREIEKADHEIQNLSWYNRFEKKLSKRHSQSKYHTPNWDHLNRDIDDVCALRGCDHDGPCERDNPDCPCAQKGQFCEKFCGCSVESCAYRFTGCACHVSRGKCCFDDQKGEPCICIQLNRECDADLCGTCGAAERADPVNARDDKLHGSGCQNCALQRGVGKSLVLGRSQLHGYGVYAAEDIRKDEFIAEYAGEIVSGAEGDRRYIRRQNLFDGTKPLSFNFTLLKECDVWVDGARFGNLSRYVNHVKEGNLQCNVTPIIMLVNGGFRIKFKAKRKIKAWEELFFDYGDDFDLEPEKDKGKKKNRASDSARKNAYRAADDDSSTYSADDHEFSTASQKHDHLRGRRKRKRDTPESLEEDYQPTSSSASTPAPSKDDAKDDAERTPVANNQGTAKRRTRRSASAQDQSTSRSPRRPLKRRRLSSKPNAKAPAKMTKAGQAINRPRNVPGSTAASAMEISDSEASNEESEDSEGSEDDEGSCDSESDERPGVDQRSDGKRGDRDDIDDESDGSEGSESQSSVSDDEGVDYDSTPTKAERPTRMRKQPARYDDS